MAQVFTDGQIHSKMLFRIFCEISCQFFINIKSFLISSNDPCATYEGEVYKGKRHGSGIFKSGTVSVTYFGEWNTGQRYGKVRFS